MLTNKVALVTGSSKRIGKAIAIALAKEGADVVIHYNNSKKEAEAVKKEIEKLGRQSIIVKADLTNPKEVEAMFKDIIKKFKKIDILINNVGNFIFKDLNDYTIKEWHHLIDTTLNTTYHCCKFALPYMRKQKSGNIINLADSLADRIAASPKLTPYMIGKTGVLILTQTLAVTEAKHGINVNSVSPGVMENSITKPIDEVPKGRYGRYEDITNAILFLLDKKSDYITGANIKVNGAWRI
ncbi:MAG TPA: SDR family oxidoreductase [Candidatus Nanoarchaeia archaeon]|nr:SDR family oxidoreductase [Candidatus Nanoarchaeia archaeon]